MKKITKPVIVVSDVHIRSPQEQNYHHLLELIENIDSSQVKHFILLGDIFDFCFGRSKYFQKKYNLLFEALEKLARGTTEVVYLHGNHEFSLHALSWSFVKIIQKESYQIRYSSNRKISFCHGDFLISSLYYKKAMQFFRSRFFQSLLFLTPPSVLNKLCLSFAKFSHKRKRKLKLTKMKDKAQKWLHKSNCNIGFIGHFHQGIMYDYKEKNQKKKVCFLPSWSKPYYVSFDYEKIETHFF